MTIQLDLHVYLVTLPYIWWLSLFQCEWCEKQYHQSDHWDVGWHCFWLWITWHNWKLRLFTALSRGFMSGDLENTDCKFLCCLLMRFWIVFCGSDQQPNMQIGSVSAVQSRFTFINHRVSSQQLLMPETNMHLTSNYFVWVTGCF